MIYPRSMVCCSCIVINTPHKGDNKDDDDNDNNNKACAVQLTRLVGYVDWKEVPLPQIVRRHQHINSAVLQTAGCLKTNTERNNTNKGRIAEKMKNGEGTGCMDNCHIT